MPHPDIKNSTGLEFSPLFFGDEEGRPVVVSLVKGTFRMAPGRPAELHRQQAPIQISGVLQGDPENPSYRYEPETALTKPATDVVLVGHAHAPAGRAVQADVGVKVGPVQKIVRVFGERYWVKQGGQAFPTKPQPFERIPLVYERSFGGWDKADKDDSNWTFDPRNPVGCGFGDPLRFLEEGRARMPNLEHPQQPLLRYGDTPPPAGFGFISPNWQGRAQYAGTYDADWDKERKPLLPKDFDRRFFNAASEGLTAPGYLRGDEEVVLVNASPTPQLRFNLPGIPPPACTVHLRGGKARPLQTNLDTIIIDTDQNLLFLLWRAYMNVTNGPHDVVAFELAGKSTRRAGEG